MTTASLGTVAHPILATFGDVFLRPGVAAHLLTLEMTMAGGWLPPGSIAPVILEGFMWSGPGMAPLLRSVLVWSRFATFRSLLHSK